MRYSFYSQTPESLKLLGESTNIFWPCREPGRGSASTAPTTVILYKKEEGFLQFKLAGEYSEESLSKAQVERACPRLQQMT